MVILAEKAGAELPVRSQADAGTMAAEGLSDRGDKANLAGSAIGKPILARRFTAFMRNLNQGPARVDALVNFRSGNDEFA